MTLVRSLLAVCLGLASSAQAGPKASVREAEVLAIARLSADGGVAARAVPLAAKVGPSRDHQPAVVVTGSAAEQCVPTFWRAAFVAAAATGSTVLEHEFSLRVDEAIDGPSSGMLLASTLVALLRNKKPLANTTMTGALNPDGTIAPVDDALGRLREAASAGVKRFGFPTGNRQQTDTSGAVVDLLSEGQRLGVAVKELGSLDDAYGFLTGDVLPRPAAAKETDLELWPAELAAVAKSSAQVRRQFETERTPYEEGLERVNPAGVAAVRQRLDRIAKQATDFEQGGDAVRALVVWSAALGMVRVGVELRALEDDQADNIAAVQRLEEALVRERLEFRQEIELRFPHNNRANDLYAMDLLESIAPEGAEPAPGARVKKLSALAPGSAELGQLAHEFVEELAQSRERVRNGRRFYELYIALPTVKEAPPLETERLAAAFAAASAASYAALEKQLTPDMQDDPTAAELAGAGEILRTERDPRARLVLAARHDIYSAYLVNTYATLGGAVDGAGLFTVRNTRGLSTQLERARLQVLQSCGRAKREAKMIPLAARLRFLNARAAREGSDRQKTESLAELWIGSWWCELAAGHSK